MGRDQRLRRLDDPLRLLLGAVAGTIFADQLSPRRSLPHSGAGPDHRKEDSSKVTFTKGLFIIDRSL